MLGPKTKWKPMLDRNTGKIFFKSVSKERPPYPNVQDVYEKEADNIYKEEVSYMLEDIVKELGRDKRK